ncbi:DUF397 domain-containing protein [Streptomyces sp. KL116D]|uniref:DUF397 domain-containing protein n=1 Tax=Streptomyces sp. KL116D TaxID=3045152 RepID=UPI0035576E33
MTQARAWAWRKSSGSAQVDDCVEVACTGAAIRVRDSKRRRGDVIAVAPAAWDSFLGFVADPGPASPGERPVAGRP